VPPDVARLETLLGRIARRRTIRAVGGGVAAGLAVAAIVVLVGWPHSPAGAALLGGTLAVAGGALSVAFRRTRDESAALFVERRAPESRNVILTAHELTARGDATGYIPALVVRRAAELASTLDPRVLVPTRQVAVAFAATLALWLFAVTRAGTPVTGGGGGPLGDSQGAEPSVDGVDVVIVPPGYTSRSPQTLRDPARIEALAGSQLRLVVRARATSLAVETLDRHDTLRSSTTEFVTTLTAEADGYVALEPRRGSASGRRRLIGVTVIPDAPPRVRIATPGHDLRLPDGKRTLDIAIEAGDDIGLTSLRLHYTKVSGSGERFTFAEGEVPIRVSRATPLAWTARATWKLDSLELGPGDLVVYRAIAADARPGREPVESDAFIAEVVAPGGVAAPGFATDPEQDRYAVSQQMVILKTERLLARRASMSAEAYANEAQELAAEQRKVRAEFVFMLGGELADAPDASASLTELNEEAEAEGEADILAGRNANAGHIALLRAIRAMSLAAASLTTAGVDAALPHERTALTNLESAFSHSRILLRALTTRERLDLTRRLTGTLTDAARDLNPIPVPEANESIDALRAALADVVSLAAVRSPSREEAARLAILGERVLRVNASSRPLQEIARQLSDASAALGRGRTDAVRPMLDSAATALGSVLRAGLPAAPRKDTDPALARMRGALRDALSGRTP